jgi:hypothetical protein
MSLIHSDTPRRVQAGLQATRRVRPRRGGATPDARRSAGLADEVAGPGDGRGRLAPFLGRAGHRSKPLLQDSGQVMQALGLTPKHTGPRRVAAPLRGAISCRRGPGAGSAPTRTHEVGVQVSEAGRSPPLMKRSAGSHLG